MTKVEDLLTRVGVLLRDEAHLQWVESELLSWYNESLTEIIRIRPEANSVMSEQPLAIGSVQSLPADGLQLLRTSLCKNSGKAPRRILLETMNTSAPTWQTDGASPNVKRYILDEDNPRQFFVYPPNDGSGIIDIVYSREPTTATAVTDAFSLPSIYETVVVNYVLFRAFGKVSEDGTNANQSDKYYSMFAESMGITDIVSKKQFNKHTDPAVTRRPPPGVLPR